jgi:hypothetical protein
VLCVAGKQMGESAKRIGLGCANEGRDVELVEGEFHDNGDEDRVARFEGRADGYGVYRAIRFSSPFCSSSVGSALSSKAFSPHRSCFLATLLPPADGRI